jgi:hypothetical protein
MRVLIACEYSGAVRDEFLKLGHDAMSCDLLPTDVPGPHYQGDVFDIINDGWDLMIAHPPCTYISRAGARWMYENNKINKIRLQQALEAKQFFLNLFNSNIKYIALENPTPLTILKMPQFTQAVQPFEFGHPYSKRTLLWLKNLPLLKSTNIIREYEPFLPSNTGGKKKGQSYSFGVSKNWKDSSTTFKGIAKAMAEQWSKPGIVQSKLF